MRTQTRVLALAGLTMVATFMWTHPVNPQVPLSEERMKRLGEYDPADIFPNARESGRGREKRRQPSGSKPSADVLRRGVSSGQATSSTSTQFREQKPSPQSMMVDTAQSASPLVAQSPQTPVTITSQASSLRARAGLVSASRTNSGSARKSAPVLILVSMIALALVTFILTIVKLMKLRTRSG